MSQQRPEGPAAGADGDPLESARLKALRALKIRGEALALLETYAKTKPYEVIAEPDGREWVRMTQPVPSDLSVLVGEVLYHLRSALDHAFYALVQRNHVGVLLPRDWERKAFFPILLKAPESATEPPLGREHFTNPCIAALTDRAFEFIESVQPYNYRQDSVSRLLEVLHILSNIDKHRRLSITVPRIEREEQLQKNGGTTTTLFLAIGDGETLAPAWSDLDTSEATTVRLLTTSVFFDEPLLGRPISAPISDVLVHLPGMIHYWMLGHMQHLLAHP